MNMRGSMRDNMTWMNESLTVGIIDNKKFGNSKLQPANLVLRGDFLHFKKGADRYWFRYSFVEQAIRELAKVVGFPAEGFRVLTFKKKNYIDEQVQPILVLRHKKISALVAPYDDKGTERPHRKNKGER